MRDYGLLIKQKASIPDTAVIRQDIEYASNWYDAYCIGQYIYEQASGEADKLIIDAYEKAFNLGLNIRVNRNCFINATQNIAKLYFQFQKYEEALNKLMILDANMDKTPDWVNLYYASAQIHTDNIVIWAESPELFFDRIDRIDDTDSESVTRRKYLFLEFINRICELSDRIDVPGIDKESILSKASELGVADSRECLNFKVAAGIIPFLPKLQDEVELDAESQPYEESELTYKTIEANLNKKLLELQSIVDKQALTIDRNAKQFADQKLQITSLTDEIKRLENNYAKQAEELKAAKEHEYSMRAKCNSLENQLNGSEAARKQLEDDSSIIGELQADVDGLKKALASTNEQNDRLKKAITNNEEIVKNLKEELIHSQDEAQELRATIQSQETLDVIKSTKQDTFDLNSILSRRKKILIIGGSEAKEKHLRGKLKNMGFVFSNEQLEFELEYDNVKDYTSRIVQWNGKYAGIIVGPCPHKAKDINGYSSFIEKMKSEEGYPHIEEAKDKSGKLKISKESIGDAMMRMAVHLRSIA